MRSRAIACVTIALIAASASGTTSALAQRVRGAMTDSSTHEPIAGAVVSISDSTGKFLARGVAEAGGHFDVPRFPGSKRVHVVRIGYRPIDATVPDGDDPLELQMRAIASQLAAVTTSGKRVCPGESGDSQALQLWEQARTGFLASVVARDARPPNLKLRYFRIERDPVLRRVVDDSVWTRTVDGDQPFVAARSASAFATQGYMHESPSGERDYFAPDETVLLDPAFAGTHCLRAVSADGAHPAQIGIAFEPFDAERDSLVDIRGTVWLDRRTLDLRTLDFDYTNIEKTQGGSGGSILFQSMPNGVPMIVRWTIHSPIIATDESAVNAQGVRRSLPPRPQRNRFRVLGYQLLGAEAQRVAWTDGAKWIPRVSAVTGVVADLRGRLVRDARVWMSGLADTALTDSNGVFRLPRPVTGGVFTIVAADSTLALGGVNQSPPKSVFVSDERSAGTDIDLDILKMYPRADALRAACPDGQYSPGKGVALVRVIDSAGVGVVGANVEMETIQSVVVGDTLSRTISRSGRTDDQGRFVICNASLDQPIALRASRGDARGEGGIARWTTDVIPVVIVLRASPPAS